MNTEETDELAALAKTPKKVEVDGQVVEQHSLQDQIALDKYLASKRSVGKRGFTVSKMRAGGAAC